MLINLSRAPPELGLLIGLTLAIDGLHLRKLGVIPGEISEIVSAATPAAR